MKVKETDVLYWLTPSEITDLPSSEYWNNEEIEKGKPFYVLDRDTNNLWEHLKNSNLQNEYTEALNFASSLGLQLRGIGLDVAAGVGWTTAFLSQIPEVKKLYALEFSQHRLLKLAPLVFDALDARQEKITRILGSFYNVQLPEASVDFCMLAQAFHHADDPETLLQGLYKVLKPGGILLIIGETPVYPIQLLKQRVKNLIKIITPPILYASKPVYKIFPSFQDLYPTNVETGDHEYRIEDYSRIFSEFGFTSHSKREKYSTVFIAVK